MPILEPKTIQKELTSGQVWPVYWIYGSEKMKSRELLKRIKSTVVSEGLSFGDEILDAAEMSAAEILDAAQSLTLGGGTRFLTIRDSHLLKDAEMLLPLLQPKCKKEELPYVCVFLSKDLDKRKKWTKQLIEKTAVIACEEIPDRDREAWIQYLAKRKGMEIQPDQIALLRSLDPWSLDLIDQELEKLSLAQNLEDPSSVLQGNLGNPKGTDGFLEAFFQRNLSQALPQVSSFAKDPEVSLPLLGLVSWNVRQLMLLQVDPKGVKLNPFLLEKFRRWKPHWDVESLKNLQSELSEIDWSLKQTPKLPEGLWADLLIRFCS